MIQDILALYQKRARNEIIHSISANQKTLVVKAPTGSGKTIILISVIDKLIFDGTNYCFVWLCPGEGNLEEQSKKSMDEKCPNLETRTLSDVLSAGFETNATYFINWETITKKGNISLKDAERRNLYKRISNAHKSGIDFILIVDEEQNNDTSKAQDVINAFACTKEIRMSATARSRPTCEFYEIDEQDVINEGFISKAICVNENLKNYTITNQNETQILIDLALAKRNEICSEYKKLKDNGLLAEMINPLIIIQFPSSSDLLIDQVEKYLETKNITYDNTLLAIWMAEAERKKNLGLDPDWDISDSNAFPIVLLMKQAISTGWDCPRAKILVKLRDNMDEDFEIQTIGRIRRMPERKHYGNDLLDYCYLYTLDTKYVESVRTSTANLFELKECKLKTTFENFVLEKELKHTDGGLVDAREALKALRDYFINKYNLKDDVNGNLELLKQGGYEISKSIIRNVRMGNFSTLNDLSDDDPLRETELRFESDTSRYGFTLMNAIAHIASACGMKSDLCSKITRRLFKKKEGFSNKLLKLPVKDYYAFIINNEDILKEDYRDAANQLTKQLTLHLDPITVAFNIPQIEKIKYDPTERNSTEMRKNVYEGYTQQMIAGNLRWKTERMLEKYCEINNNVEWIYKNGDSGIQYFSVVYKDNFGKEWLFYPDYIVKLKNGKIVIIETKGGENKDGESQNIDRKSLNKFASFKEYASKHNLLWGFVRNYSDNLYLNNTEWVDSMNDEKWIPIENIF